MPFPWVESPVVALRGELGCELSSGGVELLLIRHGRPARTHADEGPADPPLTDLGQRQAEALAAWLAEEGVDVVYASPLKRARETAAPLADKLGLSLRIDASLSEYDAQASSYVPIEELQAAGDLRSVELPADMAGFQRTVVDGIENLVAEVGAGGDKPGKVALVCHGGVINVYVSWVLHAPNEMFFLPHYTSISRVRASSKSPLGRRGIESLNETAHLRVAGIPLTEL